MWETKMFKTRQALQSFIDKNFGKLQMVEVYVNNGFALDVKPLKSIVW